ncbi:hypothetical protein [Desulfobaculum bizertense]|uniref:Uncharacterized protein n=1 Tax=Desulfobaculum bizertense DSM 18034 TaxID=1121442 RepID=A0A1T4W8K5_9BACT|nr:hypothetical protein [Desulfobaculum bizertense]SKA73610.1 hypothetical protein SAMN02745702_01886 [Desulfobaculum bizertense DSM 18034]
MRTGVKVFGTFNGISAEAFEKLKGYLQFDEVEYEGTTVSVEHNSYYPDVEFLLIHVMELMREGAESSLDILDHDENTITRFAIESDGYRTREMDMDAVTPVYPQHSHE